MKLDVITRLQNWYKINCDGDWEHAFGVNIVNIDNPGWAVTIALEDTPFDNAVFTKTIDNGDLDWMTIEIKEKKFVGHGDPGKLTVIIGVFLDEFMPDYGDPDFHYDIYEPISQQGKSFYKRLKGRIKTEDTFEIVAVPEFDYKELKADNFDDLESLNFDALKAAAILKVGDVVKCDLRALADYPTVVVIG
jgi:hypothetical protein